MSRISPSQYAIALTQCLSDASPSEQERMIAAFVEAIKKNGDWARKEKILAGVERELRKRSGKSLLRIEGARPLTQSQQEMLRPLFREEKTDIAYATDPSLIAGVRLEINDTMRFDASLSKMLDRIFS